MPPTKRGFGQLTKLPSGRIRARYTGPDGALHNAASTFESRQDGEAWLVDERRLIASGNWQSPKSRAAEKYSKPEVLTFAHYAEAWLRDRTVKPRTRQHYRALLDNQVLPTFGAEPLAGITPEHIRSWHSLTGTARPTLRAHAYGLMRSIFGSAVSDRLIPVNPCTIRGAGNSRRVHKIKPATLHELESIVAALPERYRVMALFAAWCAMRFGELAELRRRDVDVGNGVIRIRRAVVRVEGEFIVGVPKSDACIRDVAIPPHLLPLVAEHLKRHAEAGKNGLLFPSSTGGHMAPSTLYRVFYPAREAAGRPDLRWHDLRHSGAVLAAQTGATLAELMGRLGHSTPGAALRYQHAAEGRDMEIARRLSAMAGTG